MNTKLSTEPMNIDLLVKMGHEIKDVADNIKNSRPLSGTNLFALQSSAKVLSQWIPAPATTPHATPFEVELERRERLAALNNLVRIANHPKMVASLQRLDTKLVLDALSDPEDPYPPIQLIDILTGMCRNSTIRSRVNTERLVGVVGAFGTEFKDRSMPSVSALLLVIFRRYTNPLLATKQMMSDLTHHLFLADDQTTINVCEIIDLTRTPGDNMSDMLLYQGLTKELNRCTKLGVLSRSIGRALERIEPPIVPYGNEMYSDAVSLFCRVLDMGDVVDRDITHLSMLRCMLKFLSFDGMAACAADAGVIPRAISFALFSQHKTTARAAVCVLHTILSECNPDDETLFALPGLVALFDSGPDLNVYEELAGVLVKIFSHTPSDPATKRIVLARIAALCAKNNELRDSPPFKDLVKMLK